MKRHELEKLLVNLVGSGVLIIHDVYSDDGNNEFIQRYYKVNYGALKPND